MPCDKPQLYRQDLAYIHATAYEGLARGAAPEIIQRLRAATIPIRRVIDVGCGAGPLSEALIDAGFEVTGIDSSDELLTIARKSVPSATFVHGSIYDAEMPACDAVIALGEPLTYHTDNLDADDRIGDLFQRVSAVLPAGGLFIFDLIELGEPLLTARSWNSGEDWAVLVETTENQSARRLTRNIEIFRRHGELYRRGTEVHHVRLFDTRAITEQLIACGFAVETAQAYGEQRLPPRRRAFFTRRC